MSSLPGIMRTSISSGSITPSGWRRRGCANWRDYFKPPTGNNPGQKRKWLIPEDFHYDTWIAERTCALLESYKRKSESFLLWTSFFDPHPPYLAPEPWDTMYRPDALTVPTVAEGEHDRNPLISN